MNYQIRSAENVLMSKVLILLEEEVRNNRGVFWAVYSKRYEENSCSFFKSLKNVKI